MFREAFFASPILELQAIVQSFVGLHAGDGWEGVMAEGVGRHVLDSDNPQEIRR
jgi:hypothetical protein